MKKRVLLISTDLFHYRVSVLNHLNTRMHQIGYELLVLTSKFQKLNPHPIGFELIEKPFKYFAYVETIRKVNPDMIILNLRLKDYILWPLLLWLKWRNTTLLFWGHGINLMTPDHKGKRVLYSILHRFSDRIILYTSNEIKYIAEKHRDRIYIANNTLNFGDFPSIEKSKEQIKAEHGIVADKVVLFAGRITKEKRLDDLLAASDYVNDDTCIVIVGGGLDAGQERKIKLSKNIFYMGEIYAVKQVNEIFKMADVFSIPGKMGLGINQAMYWGLPVVTENVRHAPEIAYLIDGVNGFVVPQDNVKELANKINHILSDPIVYDKFSRQARLSIMKNADIDLMCDGFIGAIQSVGS